ncbi:unnamed protein product, partial [Ascophyllum nodosum]
MPVFAGHYLGYFKLTSNHQTETINESFTLQFRGHSNQGYNVYGYGENRFGKNEIVGTVTQTGKMEIFKVSARTRATYDSSITHIISLMSYTVHYLRVQGISLLISYDGCNLFQ